MTDTNTATGLPDFDEAIAAFEGDAQVREHVGHNLRLWRSVHGGLALVRKSPLEFDPVLEYWYLAERRVLVSYFSKKLQGSYLPAADLRALAWMVHTHFDQSRARGAFATRGRGDGELAGVPWREFLQRMSEETARLPDLPEYDRLRARWRRLKAATFREDLQEFLTQLGGLESVRPVEPRLANRMPWLPYLGLPDVEHLLARQRFFMGFYSLFTSTNAYAVGGAQVFGPVLQNNPSQTLVAYAERWANGEKPSQTGFLVEGSSETRDCSDYSTVLELYGLLNLHRLPFHNSVVETAYESFARPEDSSRVERLERIGEVTRSFLQGVPERVAQLATLFREQVAGAEMTRQIAMEEVLGKRNASAAAADGALADDVLIPELRAGANEKASSLTDLEAATAMLHAIVDSMIYGRSQSEAPEVTPGSDTVAESTSDAMPGQPAAPPPTMPATARPALRLPEALRPVAQDALGYLRAGHHVLLAGAPGTGKTTAAQFVAHAWNMSLQRVPDVLPWAEAPVTTVGNSAWSPFHTIGGVVPDRDGRFVPRRGIFIDPSFEKDGAWRLLNGCLVLDEMNRADLDRCIGELYPLLTSSVERVSPAGIPGVTAILLNDRFRVVATVNDATVDDIVFPISEGLARRFVRLELPGAELSETREFVCEGTPKAAEDPEAGTRREAAASVLKQVFDAAREADFGSEAELGWRIPLGVGYFGPLRSWCRGELSFSTSTRERETADLAMEVLRVCLSAVGKNRKVIALLKGLQAGPRE